MYLLYLDDAGSPGNASETYFVLGGLCVFEAQVDWFTREVDKLGAEFNAVEPEDIEFHASEIFSRRGAPWNKLSSDEARGTLKSVLQVVNNSYNTTCLFACAIDKRAYPGQDPVEMAFEDLCRRFDLFLSRLKSAGDTQRGMIILDKTTLGTQWGSLKNIADTPFFVDSRASRLVQIADHVAYSVFRRYNSGDAQYFDIIAHRFDASENIIHGLAHKHAERHACTCPACLSRRFSAGRGEPTSRYT
jgi:hypothetical protein